MNRPENTAQRAGACFSVPVNSTSRLARGPMRLLAWLLLPGLALSGQAMAQTCAVGETPAAFGFTGGEQTSVVPSDVQSARVYLSGAQGGAGRSGAGTSGTNPPNSPGGAGGLGGRVQGTVALTPGATLSIWVGGQGSQAVNPGGLGQGTDGIGGGATDIRVGGNGVGNRVAIAGGGGGGGNAGWGNSAVIAGGAGGAGGGGAGTAGGDVPGGLGPFGGGGGAVGIGGAGGDGCGSFPATVGNAVNGDGGDSFNFSGSFSGAGYGGGGGGGATVGAGGGGAGVGTITCVQNWNGGGGGGAGGASAATGLTAASIATGVQSGNGAVLICYVPSDHALSGSISGQTGAVTLQLDSTNPAGTQVLNIAQGATSFAFADRLPTGSNWNLSVIGTPSGQLCSVNTTNGIALSADVTNLAVSCVTVTTTITPASLPNGANGTAYSQTLGASSSNGGVAPYTFSLAAGALPAGLSLSNAGVLSGTPTVAGSFNFTVQAASSNGFTGTQSYTFVVDRADQAIVNFIANPAAPVFTPGGTFAVSATGGASGNPVVFASTTPTVCTVGGSTVTLLSAGVCSVTADQAGNANFNAAPQATLAVTIGAANQSISNFTATPAAPVFAQGGTFALSATPGPSTSPVVFASTTPAVCTVGGSTVTMLTSGTCSLTADQAGDGNYNASPQLALDVTIGAGTQTIAQFIANPTAPTYAPGGTFAVSASGGASGNPVTFASTTPAVCTVSGNTATMLSAGTCSLTADQAGGGGYAAASQAALDVTIGAAVPTVAWIGDLVKTIGEPAFDLPDPSSNSGGGFTFTSANTAVATVSGRRVTIVGAGVATVIATQAATGNYLQATVSATLTVADRPDPTRDPSVVGGLQAQVDASVRFASAQQANIHDRLRQQRHAGANLSSNGVSLSLSNRSGGALSLSADQLASADAVRLPPGWALWSAGTITNGQRDPNARSDGFDFRSDGITVGADWRAGDSVLLGVAGGYGWNKTDLDDSRSKLDAKQLALSVYGLWRAGEHWFVDGTVGWGRLDFDIRRWSETAGATASAQRDGDQVFGSLTAGYEHVSGSGMNLTGYGRFDASRSRLDDYREQGLSFYDLSYGAQTVENSGASLGVEGSLPIITPRGSVFRPYWMLEYRESLEDRSDVALNYVVMPASNDYVLDMRSYGDNALTYGAGMDMDIALGWRLSLSARRQHGSGQEASSSFGLMLSYSPAARSAAAPVANATDAMPATQADIATGR